MPPKSDVKSEEMIRAYVFSSSVHEYYCQIIKRDTCSSFRTYGATPVNLNIKTLGSRPYGQGTVLNKILSDMKIPQE